MPDLWNFRDFARHGGMLEMVQLWVNLPAKDIMLPPRYQSIVSSEIPATNLPNGRGSVRVIAGKFNGVTGPAHTFTPIHVWDIYLASEQPIDFPVSKSYITIMAVLKGSVRISDAETIDPAEVGIFDQEGDHIRIHSAQNATVLLLCGEPIDEPIIGSGPFVMNGADKIRQAMVDYQSGRMGHLS